MTQPLGADIGHLLRELAPQVLGAIARRHGDFAAAEDAVQGALIAAAGDRERTLAHFRAAADGTTTGAERDYLRGKISRCQGTSRALAKVPQST